MPDPVCRDLEAVLKEGNQPADQNYNPKGRTLVFQVAVPGKGHKNIRDCQKNYSFHGCNYEITFLI